MENVVLHIVGISQRILLYHMQGSLLIWAESALIEVGKRLNYLDLVSFVFGALLFLPILFLLLKRKKGLYSKALAKIFSQYQEQIKNVKNEYGERCATQQKNYKERIMFSEKRFSEHIQKLKQDHAKKHYAADKSVFELKQEVCRLHSTQLEKVEELQNKIDKLKKEISSSQENHTKKMKQSELEIRDLRKQLRLLMYKV